MKRKAYLLIYCQSNFIISPYECTRALIFAYKANNRCNSKQCTLKYNIRCRWLRLNVYQENISVNLTDDKTGLNSITVSTRKRRATSGVGRIFVRGGRTFSLPPPLPFRRSCRVRGGLGLKFQPGNSSSRGPVKPLFLTIDYLHRSRAQGCQSAMTIF